MRPKALWSRCTITSRTCRAFRTHRSRSCRDRSWSAASACRPVSTRDAAARSSAVFCTIINVQGRKSRCRSVDDIEAVIRENYAQGVTGYFITDDNFARNKDWEDGFDRLIELRECDGIRITFTI